MLIDELRGILATEMRRVVIVVGAGVTLAALQETEYAEVASWRGLLLDGLRRCTALRLLASTEVQGLTLVLQGERPELWVTVAEVVARALGAPDGGEYRRWLRETVGCFAPAVRDPSVPEALAALARRGALLATVNYDHVLSAETGLEPVLWTERSRVEQLLAGKGDGVLHLHGHWATPESVVLGTRSYEAVVGDKHAWAVLSALRMQRVFLFVGHGAGLADPNWGSFLRWTEAVHAQSETRHYRLARDSECAAVQAEHPPSQRIFAVPYGSSHADLAPFLRALVSATTPAAAGAPDVPAAASGTGEVRVQEDAGADIVLRIVVGERWYEPISELSIRRQLAGRTIVEVFEYVRFPAAIAEMEAKDWHAVAQGLDDLVRRALDAAELHPGRVRLVLAGVAPLPVFSYLGLKLALARHEILLLNPRRGGPEWDRVGTPDTRGAARRDPFVSDGPTDRHQQAGKVVLSLRCSRDYLYDRSMVQGLRDDANDAVICEYQVHRPASHAESPLVAHDIVAVRRHTQDAVERLKERCPHREALVLAIGGPSWVAFWAAHRLNPNVVSRIDLPNFLVAQRGSRGQDAYVPALVWPMERAPWALGRLRVLVLAAEPDDACSMATARECEAIRAAFSEVLGPDEVDVVVRGATQVSQIQRALTELRPHILHVSVHGSADRKGRLLFEDPTGDGVPLDARTFVAMLKASADSLVAVVASVCYWGPYAEALTELAKFVVATDAELPLPAAAAFARSFYAGAARGEAVGPAFERAKNDARAACQEPSVDALRPIHAADIDPGTLTLRWPRGRRRS